MSDTKFIKGNCYECGGSIEYPSYVTTEVVSCPHCQKMVMLKRCVRKQPIDELRVCLCLACGQRVTFYESKRGEESGCPTCNSSIRLGEFPDQVSLPKPKNPWWMNPGYQEPAQDVDQHKPVETTSEQLMRRQLESMEKTEKHAKMTQMGVGFLLFLLFGLPMLLSCLRGCE